MFLKPTLALFGLMLTSTVFAQYPHPPHAPGHGHATPQCGAVDVHNQTRSYIHFDVYDSHNREIISYNLPPGQELHFNAYACPSARVELNDTGHMHSLAELAAEGHATWNYHEREWHLDINHLF